MKASLIIALFITLLFRTDVHGQSVFKEKKSTKLTSTMIAALSNAERSGSKEVAAVFSSQEFRAIYSRLYEDHKTKILSGKYCIKKNFENEDVVNYIFGTACPLTFPKMEFALQFNKAK